MRRFWNILIEIYDVIKDIVFLLDALHLVKESIKRSL